MWVNVDIPGTDFTMSGDPGGETAWVVSARGKAGGGLYPEIADDETVEWLFKKDNGRKQFGGIADVPITVTVEIPGQPAQVVEPASMPDPTGVAQALKEAGVI